MVMRWYNWWKESSTFPRKPSPDVRHSEDHVNWANDKDSGIPLFILPDKGASRVRPIEASDENI